MRMSPYTLPQAIHLNPLQQWRFFSQPASMYSQLSQQYPDLVVFHFQGRDVVGILSSKGIQQVFSAEPDGYDVFWKEAFTGLSGSEVVFVLAGEKHRRERQLFAPTFNAHNYRAYAETIRALTRHHTSQWQPGQTVRAVDTTSTLWLDIITHLFFGSENNKYFEAVKRIHTNLQHSMHPLIVFFPALQRHWFPFWRRYDRARTDFSDWVIRYLAERHAQGREIDDVTGHILALRDEDDYLISDERIRDAIYSFLGPGHQTTATALAWALYELGRHPAVLEKLRVELSALEADSDLGLLVTQPYLSAVCNETLRLHPIIVECARVPIAPMEILGYTIPAGLGLVISITGIHHDPALYPEPERFIPERFIERAYTPFEFLP